MGTKGEAISLRVRTPERVTVPKVASQIETPHLPDPPRQRQGPATDANRHHHRLMQLGRLGLVDRQHDRLPAGGYPSQHLAAVGGHHRVAGDQIIGQ